MGLEVSHDDMCVIAADDRFIQVCRYTLLSSGD